MTPIEQSRLAKFLGEILPAEYYTVVNGEFIEVHKKEIIIKDDKPSLQVPLFEEKQCKFSL
jgi:hypothetical protein